MSMPAHFHTAAMHLFCATAPLRYLDGVPDSRASGTLRSVFISTVVTGNPALLEIWHPRVKFPRELGIPAGDLAPSCIPGNLASPE